MSIRPPDANGQKTSRPHSGELCLSLALLIATAGCGQQMADQLRVEPLEEASFFENSMGSRHLVPGTVARGYDRLAVLSHAPHFTTGMVNGELVDQLPEELVDTSHSSLRELLVRGRERYEIFCSHCHDLAGTGQGSVPQRGYPQPPTFHSRRLREVRLGHIFRVITEGRGKMPAHGPQIPVQDRWAIAAFVRSLQFSQHAEVSGLPRQDREQLEGIQEPPQ